MISNTNQADLDMTNPLEREAVPTIAEIVSQSGAEFDDNGQNFNILLRALEAAGLTDAVADPDADLTVYAPSDAAFVQLAKDFGFDGDDETGAFDAIVAALTELGDGDPIPLLQDVLKYHVSAGSQTLAEIQAADSLDTLLEGATITPDGNSLQDNEPDIDNPEFIEGLTDIEASNGTIQAIDRVLIPLDIPGNDSAPEDNLPTVSGTPDDDVLFAKDDGKMLATQGNRFSAGGGDDIVRGSAGADLADGGAGDDIISGNGGNDTLRGGAGNDTVIGGADADELRGGIGADLVIGKGGDDALFGGQGDDTLVGSAEGKQVFTGGQGSDRIVLNGGADTVVLRRNSGTDTVVDFEIGQSVLGLSSGLEFENLTFTQGSGFSSVSNGTDELARLTGISVAELNVADNFAVL